MKGLLLMPSTESAELNQYAVLWSVVGTTAYGDPTFASPVEIRVRWEDSYGEKLDPESGAIKAPATIVVSHRIVVDSLLWLGRLKDLPSPPQNIRQVINYKEIPDVKGREFRREVDVIKCDNTTPIVG